MFWLLKFRDEVERLASQIGREMREMNARLDAIENRLDELEGK